VDYVMPPPRRDGLCDHRAARRELISRVREQRRERHDGERGPNRVHRPVRDLVLSENPARAIRPLDNSSDAARRAAGGSGLPEPQTPPCPMCKGTISKVTDVRTEPVVRFTCAKCRYSWCVEREGRPFKSSTS
jgi:hypothetical protein